MRGGGFHFHHHSHAGRASSNRGSAIVANTIELTVFTKTSGILSKRISLDENGKVNSDGSACGMGSGRAQRVRLSGLDDLAALIEKLKSIQALALGPMPANVGDEVAIATKSELTANTIARTTENFKYIPGRAAFVLIDHDTKGMPPSVAARIESLRGFWDALTSVIPALKDVGHVIRRSTSSGLSRADTGEQFEGSSGVHAFP